MVKIDMDRTSQIAFIKLTDEQKKKFAESILNNIEKLRILSANFVPFS